MASIAPPSSMRCERALSALLVGIGLAACGDPPAPTAAGPRPWTAAERAHLADLRLSTALPPSPTNRWADDADAAALGRQLFYDPGLSPSGEFSCATCHDPARHFTDGLAKSEAAGTTARHAPTVEGNQHGPWFFWDGRADSLWSQAAGPLESADEMDSDRLHVAHHLATNYAEPYVAIFGPLPDLAGLPARGRPDPAHPEGALHKEWLGLSDEQRQDVDRVFTHALKAIEAFERTVLPGEAPFDRFADAVLAGDPTGGGHLDTAAERGLRLFLGRGNCVACHHGPMFTDHAFHNLGLPEPAGFDVGRTQGAALVASSPLNCRGPHSDAERCEELRFLNPTFEDFRGAFKTPTLRNVAETAPYMHHGGMPDLPSVLAFYSELPTEPLLGHRELTLEPLSLTSREVEDLVAFLESLTAPVRPEALPPETTASR